MANLSSQAGV